MKRDLTSSVAMACLILITQMTAIALALPFRERNFQAFENPEDIANPIVYIVFILVFTGIILAIIKMGRKKLIKYFVLMAVWVTSIFVFYLPFFYLFSFLGPLSEDLAAMLSAILLSTILIFLLLVHPEWYVMDAVGFLLASGVMAIIGISFALLPAIILLVALAVYDAVSVYKTKHMITLADVVTEEKLPILLVVPRKLSYSLKNQGSLRDQLKTKKKREAFFMGLGDTIIPGILAVSAFVFLDARLVCGLWANLMVSLCTIAGTLGGFGLLLHFVLKGNPQAGLPLLNSGAIIGYLISYLVFYRDFAFGIM